MWAGALSNCQGGATHFTTLWLCVWGGLGEGTVLLPVFWMFAWHLPISSLFIHSPYATGTLTDVALPVNLRKGEFAYILRSCRTFKQSLLKIQQFLPPPQLLLLFIARSYGDLSSQCWNSRLCSLAWVWDHSLPRYP